MNTFYKLQNDHGVKVNIRAHFSGLAESRNTHYTAWLLNLPSSENSIPATKKPNQDLWTQSKKVIVYILSLPLLLGKKFVEFFEHNPYSYPMYPFHFPILIHSDYDLFGYTDHWDLLDQQLQDSSLLEKEEVKSAS